MTNTYMINAWCQRPFIATIDIRADTPEEAIAIVRRQLGTLRDTAEECNGEYPWNEFAAYDDNGKELLHVLDEKDCLEDAAPEMLEALTACELQLREYVRWHHANAGGCSVEIEDAWEQARAAIAQATVPAVSANQD